VSFTDLSTEQPDLLVVELRRQQHLHGAESQPHLCRGTFTVSLTATNSAGSDGETKTNYITADPSYVYVYPTSYSIHGNTPGVTLVSGTLSDVQSSNDVYMQFPLQLQP